ncbi:hypothetical protein HK100_008163 [Physocladia obscura]|uniref:Uncharacterized protein n=1 Tax=Physocladia obscura TaxID=109957 RepID=A0AAD5XAB4_9FUNG|nr:hypothetical protein HK100_008163 [Physocladia obscura]
MSAESNFGVGGEHKLNLQTTTPAHFQFGLPAPNDARPQIQQQNNHHQPLLASAPGQPPFGPYKYASQSSNGPDGFASYRPHSFSNFNSPSGPTNNSHHYDTLPSQTQPQNNSNSFHQSTAHHQNYQPYTNQSYHPQSVNPSSQPAYSPFQHQLQQRPTYPYGQYPPQPQYLSYPPNANYRSPPNFLPPPVQSAYGPPPAVSYRAPPPLQTNAHSQSAASLPAVPLVRPPPVIPSSTSTSNLPPRAPTLVQSQMLHSQRPSYQQPSSSPSQNSQQQQQLHNNYQQKQKKSQSSKREVSSNDDTSQTKQQLSKKRGRPSKAEKQLSASSLTLLEVASAINSTANDNGLSSEIKPPVKKKSRIDSIKFDDLHNDEGADFETQLSAMASFASIEALTENDGNVVSTVTVTATTTSTTDGQQHSSKIRIGDDLDPLQLSIAQPLYPLKSIVSEHSLIRMPANLGIRETIDEGGDNESNSSSTMRVTNILPLARTTSRVKTTRAKRPSKLRTFKKFKESEDNEDEEDEEADNDETGDWKYNSHSSKIVKKERVESKVIVKLEQIAPPPPQIVFDEFLLDAQRRRLSLPESLDLLSVVDIIREFGSNLLKLEGFDDLSFGKNYSLFFLPSD